MIRLRLNRGRRIVERVRLVELEEGGGMKGTRGNFTFMGRGGRRGGRGGRGEEEGN